MEFLPKEIIHLEILPWIPAKSLIRFKCVSKEWYRLINGLTFINLHRKRTLESPTLDDMILVVPHCLDVRVYARFDSVPQTRNNGTLLNKGPAVVVGCCNGLICLELAHSRFVLVDPLSKKSTDYALIPRLDTYIVSREYGFGYDDVGHVYKIVNIRTCLQGLQERVHVVNVFSTGTHNWEVVNDFPSWLTKLFCPGVSINNKLHWIANNNTDHEHGCIVTLDLHSQVFGEMSIPTINGYPSGGCDLMVTGKFIYLYMQVREQDMLVDSFAELWVMKEYGVTKSWTKLHGFSHRDFPNWWSRKWLIAFKPKEQAMLTTCFHKPTWYNLHDNSTTKLDVLDIRYNHTDTRHAKPWVCVQTLASTTLFQTSTPTSSRLHRSIT
ncbi:F-box/kelch-repeat protein At3g23880-like [Silene latifolia]|uniref:F-box/kelch-repeat protein At3g23880-like n=1 Tax=Silene latifolia TaxID=37657 RepID=UPI003D76C15F